MANKITTSLDCSQSQYLNVRYAYQARERLFHKVTIECLSVPFSTESAALDFSCRSEIWEKSIHATYGDNLINLDVPFWPEI